MAVVQGTGLGASISAFGFAGFTIANWEVITISGYEETIAALDDTHLGSTKFMEKVPTNLADIAPMVATVYWDFDQSVLFANLAGTMLPGDVGTITIDLPPRPSLSGGDLTGTGFILRIKSPDLNVGERSIGEIEFQFDGKTGPTYTEHP